MQHYESVIVGHITKDINIDHEDNVAEICGGAVLYSSAAAHALGHKVAVVTKINRDDSDRISQFTVPEEDIYLSYCEKSTTIKNKYYTPDKERRDCVCLSKGTPFEMSDIEGINGDLIHFAGLVYGDFSDEMIVECSKKCPVAVDVQGLLRHVDEKTGNMFFSDWETKKSVLPHIKYLKTDAAEAEILTGETDRKKAAEILYSWGASEILITHNTEVIVYDGKNHYACPLKPRNLSGRTGRGDTTFASYLTERKNSDIPQALLMAAATVSLKMETPGAFRGTRDDVLNYIKEFY